jgi:tetratricopeptide (TPR) repeat protein
MTYPGNPSLSPDVQRRILTTYRQSLQSAQQGNVDEALLGCDFVLRLDPQFGAARTLQQMISARQPPEAFAGLLAALDGTEAPPGASDLRSSFGQMLAERRFAEILNAAERDKRLVSADPELARLVAEAQSRYEADPYVAKFADAAALAMRTGERDEAQRLIDKARSLDATHPRIAELDEMAAHYNDPAREMGGRRRGISVEEDEAPAASAPPEEAAGAALELPELDFSFGDLAAEAGGGAEGAEGGDEAPGRPSEETSGRIVGLLTEGQAAFDRGEYQGAIDAWSRIFLIDIDHEEAARKIERARQLKSEREREIEEIFHDGVARFDAGDLAGSRQAFQRVLELNSGYALAREYLEKLDERESGVALPGAGLPELAPVPGAAAPPKAAEAKRRPSGELPLPSERPPAREGPRRPVGSGYAAKARKSGTGPSLRFVAIGGAVLALLALAGWLLFTQRERLFPNAKPTPAPVAPAEADLIARARELQEQGRTAMAVAQLRRVPPQDSRYAEAQSLISQWEKLAAPAATEVDPRMVARRRSLLEQAQASIAESENFRARRLFAQAAELAPLDGDWARMAAAAEEKLRPLTGELQLFKDGDYEYLVGQLWRRREAEPNNRDVARMLVDAYYDLGVLDLQRGDPAGAREKFREARAIDGSDPGLQRLERFATGYEKKSQDLLYRIFVKYLPMR